MESTENKCSVVKIESVQNKNLVIETLADYRAKDKVKTSTYYLNLANGSKENQDISYVSIDNVSQENTQFDNGPIEDSTTEYVAVEVQDSGQIILHEKNVILWDELCRICANGCDQFIPIFTGEGFENNLSQKIHEYLPIQISENDDLPHQLCYNCASTLIAYDDIYKGCISAQERLNSLQSKLNKQELVNNSIAEDDDHFEQVLEDKTEEIDVNKDKLEENGDALDENYEEGDRSDCVKTKSPMLKSKKTENFHSVVHTLMTIASKSKSLKDNTSSLNLNSNDYQSSSTSIIEDICLKEELEKESVKKTSDFKSVKDKILYIYLEDINNSKISFNTNEDHNFLKELDSGLKNKTEKIVEKKSVEFKKKNKEPQLCPKCGKFFSCRIALRQHLRIIHDNQQLDICNLCGKQFRSNGGLLRHINVFHSQIKKFSCNICDKKFSNKVNRDDHVRSHTGERPYECKNCNAKFRSKPGLLNHQKIHKNDYPYICRICDKNFRRKQELQYHLTIHTGEYKFKCDECKKKFRIKAELNRHMLIHTDTRPFKCNICNSHFRQQRYLNRHRARMHTESSDSGNHESFESILFMIGTFKNGSKK